MGPNYQVDTSAGNYWTTVDHFPSFIPTPYYLHANGRSVSTAGPPTNSQSASIIYDPKGVRSHLSCFCWCPLTVSGFIFGRSCSLSRRKQSWDQVRSSRSGITLKHIKFLFYYCSHFLYPLDVCRRRTAQRCAHIYHRATEGDSCTDGTYRGSAVCIHQLHWHRLYCQAHWRRTTLTTALTRILISLYLFLLVLFFLITNYLFLILLLSFVSLFLSLLRYRFVSLFCVCLSVCLSPSVSVCV